MLLRLAKNPAKFGRLSSRPITIGNTAQNKYSNSVKNTLDESSKKYTRRPSCPKCGGSHELSSCPHYIDDLD
jgi:hypothetical protein